MSLWSHLWWARVCFNVLKLRKEENEKLRKENEQLRKENEQLRKNNVVNNAIIKESIKKPKETKSPKEYKNTTDYYPYWFDKNKTKNISAMIDSNRLLQA